MSKMSNLKKGVVGVCAATMLAGLCAAPAFGADGTVAPTDKTEGTATSSVTVLGTDVSGVQLSATVPASVPLLVNVTDGTVASSANELKVINTGSTFGLKVKDVKIADAGDAAFVSDAATPAKGTFNVKVSKTPSDPDATLVTKASSALTGWTVAKAANSSLQFYVSGAVTPNIAMINALQGYDTASAVATLTWTVGLDDTLS